jgi:L-galactose dehydrogenase
MQTTILGRTNLVVSRAGLGCGGHARLGQAYGHSVEQSVALVRTAMDAGVNFIDTAAVYGTEEIVGAAIKSHRENVVLSSKHGIVQAGTSPLGDSFLDADAFCRAIEGNLKRLGTDYIDILHLHGVTPAQYEHCAKELVPALLKLREQGKIRYLGLTERFISDTNHSMLNRAIDDAYWDVVMTGFNFINPSARDQVLAKTRAKNIGTLIMFAVRRALSKAEATLEIIQDLKSRGQIDLTGYNPDDPLSFLNDPDVANSLTEAAYRFCRHEPGADVVLTGTGSTEHLRENLAALQLPQLPQETLAHLKAIFGNVNSVSGN